MAARQTFITYLDEDINLLDGHCGGPGETYRALGDAHIPPHAHGGAQPCVHVAACMDSYSLSLQHAAEGMFARSYQHIHTCIGSYELAHKHTHTNAHTFTRAHAQTYIRDRACI